MNDPVLVNRFGELLSTDLDSPISLVNIDGSSLSFPIIVTQHVTAMCYLDSRPFRGFVQKAPVSVSVYLPNSPLVLSRYYVEPEDARTERIGRVHDQSGGTSLLRRSSEWMANCVPICLLQEKEKLLKMTAANPEGKELYQQWVLQDNRSLLHILEDLPSCKPPLDLVCELLTRLQARYYSISSSSKVNRH